MLPDHVSVAIVGAGPVGLTLANLLGRLGVDTLVVERNAGLYDIPRAIVLDDEGARTLQAAGLERAVMPLTLPARGARYYDAAGRPFAEVGPGTVEFGFPKRNYFHQPEIERALLDGLRRFDTVRVVFATELADHEDIGDGVRLSLRTAGGAEGLTADWLVACDGARSGLRRRLGIVMAGEGYPEDWLIVDTSNDPDTEPVSKFFCRTDRPYVSIPAPMGGRRYEFRAAPGESARSDFSDEAIRLLLRPMRDLDPADIERKTVYTFEARLAERFRQGRVLLAGDAAHLTPPFAGQGMNAGLRDAHNIAWKLWLTTSGRAGPDLLDTYEAERRGPATAMIRLAVAMGDIVMPRSAGDEALRDAAVGWLGRFPEARDYLLGMKFKPPPRYTAGAFVDLDDQPFAGSLVGSMLPQPAASAPNGVAQRIDDVIGPGFGLVVQSAELATWVAENRCRLWPELAPTPLVLDSRRLGAGDLPLSVADLPHLVVQDDAGARRLRAHRDQVLLVRPDRYVAAALWPGEYAMASAPRFLAPPT